MTLYEKALQLAVTAHEGQVRKHDNSPYIVHPIMVARIVEEAGFSKTVAAAALTHDVLEDTTVTAETLRTVLGAAVLEIVQNVSEDKSLPWEARKARYVETVVAAGVDTWAVSVADKIHNATNLLAILESEGEAAWSYFNRGRAEKLWFERLLYSELRARWQHPLLDTYDAILTQIEATA
jgi:guanosine-3',5'-bis(diphosphate) 3'-pyrophosphohydrolase